MRVYSQDVANDPNSPQVGGVADWLKANHFRGHKLGGAKEDLQCLHGLKLAGQTKVDDLDSVSSLGQAKNIFRL